MQVLDSGDFTLHAPPLVISNRMDREPEDRVTAKVNEGVFGVGYTQPANRPHPWSGA